MASQGEARVFLAVRPWRYSPSSEYPVACYRDEWRGELRCTSKSEGGSASAQFRLDTPQLAAGSFMHWKCHQAAPLTLMVCPTPALK
jgi:hypothetical protein